MKIYNLKNTGFLFNVMFFFLSLSLNAQKLELNGGVLLANYYTSLSADRHYGDEHKYKNGFWLGVGYDSVKIFNKFISVGAIYNNYRMQVKSGLAFKTYSEINELRTFKQNLTLIFYPFRINIMRQFQIRFGLGNTILLNEKNTFVKTVTYPNYNVNIYNNYKDISLKNLWNINIKFSLKFNFQESVYIYPQCIFSYALQREFRNEIPLKSIKYFIGVGVRKKLFK